MKEIPDVVKPNIGSAFGGHAALRGQFSNDNAAVAAFYQLFLSLGHKLFPGVLNLFAACDRLYGECYSF